jgi:excisionase family DNA binding protein
MTDTKARPARQVPRLSLSRAETARALGVSVRVIDQLLADKTSGFPFARIGKRIVIPTRELEDWLRDRLENGREGQLL